jgi:hypothetical protein
MKGKEETEFLRSAFKEFGCDSIADFCRQTNSVLSQESWGAVINRGDKISVRALMVMCAELNRTPDEMRMLLIRRGETVIEKWIQPVQLTLDEKNTLEKIRNIKDAKKIKLFHDLIDSMQEA